MADKKSTYTFLVLVVIVIIVIIVIMVARNTTKITYDENLIKCLANKSTLYYQTGCSHCENQKDTLGDGFKMINSINCFDDVATCGTENITAVPTWKIDGVKYSGYKTLKELKDISGC